MLLEMASVSIGVVLGQIPFNQGVKMRQCFVFVVLKLLVASNVIAESVWREVGKTIHGHQLDAYFAATGAKISGDATTIVVGEQYLNNNDVRMSGNIQVHKFDSEGNLIDTAFQFGGTAVEERVGQSVAISYNGEIVAYGAVGADGYTGRARVFEYDTKTLKWKQRGSDLVGPDQGAWFGSSVSLSADGSIVAVTNLAGKTFVFVFAAGNWYQMGAAIDLAEEHFGGGSTSALSADGLTVAVGSMASTGSKGYARVFQYDAASKIWRQVGKTIFGAADDDMAGVVSLSANGTILAVGSRGNDYGGVDAGLVRVYRYSSPDNAWLKIGGDLKGDKPGIIAGFILSLSAEGNYLAVGSWGGVFMYAYDSFGEKWEARPSVNGSFDRVSLSSDGRRAVFANAGCCSGSYGRAQVYEIVEVTKDPTGSPTKSPTPLFCPAGSEAVDGKEVCNKCPTGMFRNEAMPKCAPCADGNEPNDTQSDCIDAGVSKDTVYSVVVPAVLSVVAAAGGYLFKKRRQQQSTEVLQSSAGAEKA